MFSEPKPLNLLKRKTIAHELSISAQQKTNLKSTGKTEKLMQAQGSHRTLFYRQPSKKRVGSYSTVFVSLEGGEKKVYFEQDPEPEDRLKKERPSVVITIPIKTEKLIAKGTQTDYRESETQTLPWTHEIKARGKILAELVTLDWFISDKNYPPGVEEVTLIERARQTLSWEDLIEKLKGKENEMKRESLALRVAVNEAAFVESGNYEKDKERIEISKRQMKEAMKAFEENLCLRLQKSYVFRRRESDSKIDYWSHQLTREIRKMKSARGPPTTKPSIIEMHKDRGSDLWAPKLRYGENPLLRHEIIDIQCRYLKRFHGLETLEKHISGILFSDFEKSNGVTCISKLSKPELCQKKFRNIVVEVPKEEKKEYLSLKIPGPPPSPEPFVPKISRIRSDSEEKLHQASLLLGKVIKGRSIQSQKFIQFFKE